MMHTHASTQTIIAHVFVAFSCTIPDVPGRALHVVCRLKKEKTLPKTWTKSQPNPIFRDMGIFRDGPMSRKIPIFRDIRKYFPCNAQPCSQVVAAALIPLSENPWGMIGSIKRFRLTYNGVGVAGPPSVVLKVRGGGTGRHTQFAGGTESPPQPQGRPPTLIVHGCSSTPC